MYYRHEKYKDANEKCERNTKFFHCVIKIFYYTAFKRSNDESAQMSLVGDERAALTPEKRQGQ